MTPERLGAVICLIAIGAVAVARFPFVYRNRRARPSWVALALGVLAFLATGSAIPIEHIDALLGNQNYVNLFQNALAVAAFWLLLEAARARGREFQWRRCWHVPCIVTSFAIPFMLIPKREGTSSDFINAYASHWALWCYASTYMLWVATLAVLTVVEVADRRSVRYVAIRLGCLLVAAGSLSEVAYLTLRLVGVSQQSEPAQTFNEFFAPLFYGGIAVLAIGLATFGLVRATRGLVFRSVRFSLARANQRRASPSTVAMTGEAPMDAYSLAVALVDAGSRSGLAQSDRAILSISSRVLDMQTRAPRIVRMRAEPVEMEP